MKLACLTAGKDGALRLKVHVQPKASRNSLCGLYDGCLKVTVTAPPVDSKANKAVVQYLAKVLHVPRKSITLLSGQSSRRKTLIISGVNREEFREHIQSLVENGKK